VIVNFSLHSVLDLISWDLFIPLLRVPALEEIIEHHIARRVRQFWVARGLTLQELSMRTGFSKGLLSKIENCNVSPPIGTLSKLATAFEISIGEFFENDGLDPGLIYYPKSKRQTVQGRRSYLNYTYELLVSGRARRDMQPMLVTLNGKNYKLRSPGACGRAIRFHARGLDGIYSGR
jgi:transcriptional regulator with XRE-family HTH domain